MYELFQRVCTTITNISSFFWPQTRLVNTAKRPRDQIVDITEDDDDDVVICNSKKLKLFSTHLPGDDTSHMKSAKTQTEGMTRKRAEKARPWRFQLSSKENWQAPIEVVDLVEETPNKFKSLYRPPQHVRSPHRVRRKSIGGTKHKVEINNGVNSSNDNKLSPKSINPKNILKNSWPTDLTTMAYKQSRSSLSQNDDAVASFQRSNCLQKELDHDAYSKMLNSYIRKEPQPLQTATNTGVTVDLTADSEEELASSSGVTTRSNDRAAKLLEDGNISAGVSNSSLDKKGPNRRRVRPSLAGIEVNISRSRQIISLDDDDDDEEDDDDSVQFIKTPSVPKVNSLEDKIKAKSLVADQDWTADIMRQYEDKKAEMEEMIKMLSMELKIASERNRNNFNDYTVRLLSRHLEITESVLDEALPQLTQEMLCVVKKATRKDPANEVLISKYNYNIKRADVHTLTGLNWLNDEVINFYITLIMERSKENSSLPKCYSFSTFFYLRLLNSGYSGVRRWTRKIDIFAHDLILIPVHLKMHWCLAAIDFVNRTINYYDSMGTTNDQCLNKLEEYIIEEYKDKKGEQFNMEAWSKNNVKDIPQQMNGSDCGVFCCTFAEFLSRRAKFTFLQKDMPEIRQKMIYEIVTGKLLT